MANVRNQRHSRRGRRAVLLFVAAAAFALIGLSPSANGDAFMAPGMSQALAVRSGTATAAEQATWGSAAGSLQPNMRQGVTAQRIFGLGTSEILVILAVGAFFFGPDKLKELAGEAGKAAGDLKDVPKAFEDGMKTVEESKAKKSDDKEAKDAEVVSEKKDDKA
eukprot:CAMPEP_0195062392 /NCGR_PEP_ID=MMETSP0448-20130528/9030_1 /TAXON_ID=66468 /ORGANISM="Heterocapsa triquestra, Strain CCMP 448" /LENGTH=163 /DNA_ID=CAMNT_0040093073 /DNA_START=66 /DNA_END=557 /DNA_ORIENTATION=+